MMTEKMISDYLNEHFKVGDIIFFFDKNNPEFHYSNAARFLNLAQSLFELGDSSTVHVGLIVGVNPNPAKPGETQILIIDSMPKAQSPEDFPGINIRPLVRNFTVEVFRLRSNTSYDSGLIAKTALDVAKEFIQMGYSFQHCVEAWAYRALRQNTALNEYYTKHLCEIHLFNPADGSIEPDRVNGGMNCSEAVITWYQLAFLKLYGLAEVANKWPAFIEIHANSTPTKLHHFVENSPYYEKISAEHIQRLRFSGHPDPRDHSMLIIPYVPPDEMPPPPPPSWTSWYFSQWPTLPAIPQTQSLLSFNRLWNPPRALALPDIELRNSGEKVEKIKPE